jgi:RNA polymerase sigma factor (sigma-70 family)
VARNLCLDRLRARQGRFRAFESIARLPLLEQLVFRRRYRDRLSLADTFAALRPEVQGLTLDAVAAADLRVNLALTSRQVWTLIVARPRFETLSASADDPDAPAPFEPTAGDPNPEELLAARERHAGLREAIAALPPEDRLLVRLRMEQSLTLAELAKIFGMRDPQQVDRRLRAIYRTLRDRLE